MEERGGHFPSLEARMKRMALLIPLLMIPVLGFLGCGGGGGGGSAAPQTPTVNTSAAVPGIENAILVGEANPHGLATQVWFEYGTSNNLTGASSTINDKRSAGDNNATVQMLYAIPGLSPWTDYYYRVVAENSAGEPQRGNIVSFKTKATTPTATTGVADNLASTGLIASATINGILNPNGLVTAPVFEWGITEDLSNTQPDHTFTFPPKTGKGNQTISADLTNLELNTDYWFRVVGTNTAGIVTQGKTVKFRTPPNPLPNAVAGPDTTVGPAKNSSPITVTLDGSKSSDVAGGTITSYKWEQTSGPAVILSDDTAAIATFVAPVVPSYPGIDLRFKLTVTSSRGPYLNTDTTKVTVKWGYLDDFGSDTTAWIGDIPKPDDHTIYYYMTEGGYTVRVYAAPDIPSGEITQVPGEGMNYDSAYQRVQAKMSVNHGVTIARALTGSSRGVFTMDFYPDQNYGDGAGIAFRLVQDPDNYYEISNWVNDGWGGTPTIKKVAGGTVVDTREYPNRYLQGSGTILYPIKVTFSPTQIIWEAFDYEYVYTDPGGRTISVQSVELGCWQQDASFDNILLEPAL